MSKPLIRTLYPVIQVREIIEVRTYAFPTFYEMTNFLQAKTQLTDYPNLQTTEIGLIRWCADNQSSWSTLKPVQLESGELALEYSDTSAKKAFAWTGSRETYWTMRLTITRYEEVK